MHMVPAAMRLMTLALTWERGGIAGSRSRGERAHHGIWDFRFVRGNPRTGAGTYAYTATDFDITACVSLSLERVAFFPGVQRSIRLSTADFLRPDSEVDSWTRALSIFSRQH
jgi:hypothetical protein